MTLPSPRLLGLVPFSKAGNLAGGILITLSMSLFVLNDSLIRSLQQTDNPFGVAVLPLSTIIALRGTLVVLMLLGLVFAVGERPAIPRLLTNRWNWGRGVVEAAVTVLFLSALPFLPFAIASTLIASNPIFLVLLGILLFSERVGWRRWLAIFVGFGGLILTSMAMDAGDFDQGQFRWWAIPACLIAAGLVAFRDVFTRYIGDQIPPVTVALCSALFVMLAGWIYSLWGWQNPDLQQVLMLLVSSFLIMFAYVSAVFAIRLGVFAVVGPLRFVSLVVAFSLGIFLFQEPFSWIGFLGAVLIVGAAIWILLRQAQLDDQAEQS